MADESTRKLAKPFVKNGQELFDSGRIDAALREYKKALQIDPDCAEARYKLGIAYYSYGRSVEAMREVREARRLAKERDPDLAEDVDKSIEKLKKEGAK